MDIIKFESMSGYLKDAFGYQEENFGNYHPEMIARQTKMESEIEQLLLGGPRKKLRQMERKVRDLIQTKKTSTATYLKRLYDADTELFSWRSGKGRPAYTTKCQGPARTPKLLTELEKNLIDKLLPCCC